MDTLSTAGWDAITHTLLAQYPSQTDPIHYAPPVSYRLGGSDPLDGISIYDGGEFYHFVTYGFSELYEKESENEQYSGFGFELTLKLRKSCIRKREKSKKISVVFCRRWPTCPMKTAISLRPRSIFILDRPPVLTQMVPLRLPVF